MNQPSTPEPATSSNSSSGTEPSGADLARLAFRQARQDAKAHGNQTRAPRRRPAPGKREGRDPAGLSTVVAGLLAERAWDLGVSGGSILDRWPDIAAAVSPQLPHHVTAVAYHPETRQLDLRPDSPAYGMQLGLITPQIIAAANRPAGDGAAQDGGGPVRTIRVLPFGASPPSPAARTSPPATARPAADVPTQPRKPPRPATKAPSPPTRSTAPIAPPPPYSNAPEPPSKPIPTDCAATANRKKSTSPPTGRPKTRWTTMPSPVSSPGKPPAAAPAPTRPAAPRPRTPEAARNSRCRGGPGETRRHRGAHPARHALHGSLAGTRRRTVRRLAARHLAGALARRLPTDA